jgi:hypothetical protein
MSFSTDRHTTYHARARAHTHTHAYKPTRLTCPSAASSSAGFVWAMPVLMPVVCSVRSHKGLPMPVVCSVRSDNFAFATSCAWARTLTLADSAWPLQVGFFSNRASNWSSLCWEGLGGSGSDLREYVDCAWLAFSSTTSQCDAPGLSIGACNTSQFVASKQTFGGMWVAEG